MQVSAQKTSLLFSLQNAIEGLGPFVNNGGHGMGATTGEERTEMFTAHLTHMELSMTDIGRTLLEFLFAGWGQMSIHNPLA